MLIFLKYLSLYLCSLYATTRICHVTVNSKKIFLESASLSLLVWLIAIIFPNQYAFLPFILYLGYIYMMLKNIRLSIVGGFISYSFSLALMTLIGFIISSILPCYFFDNVLWCIVDTHINSSNIFAYHSKHTQDNSAHEQ